ncbi:MAG: hypothetical protein ACHQF2_11660, partial [Flavobacteriales bacterium]
TVPVRNPLMVLATLPRVLGPGEELQLPVNLFALEKHIKNVQVEVEVNEMFKITGKKTAAMKFSAPGDEIINFPIKVTNSLGIGKIKVTARCGKEVSKHEIEIDIRSPNPRITDSYEAVVDAGKSWSANLAFNGLKGSHVAVVEVSAIPPINLGDRIKYLVQYPHGCIEQTTSSVFPQLYISDMMDIEDSYKTEISENIRAAIKRLSLFQTSTGGFAYWPGGNENTEWGTNYAAHFLMEAEAKGYSVPSSLKTKLVSYLKTSAQNYRVPSATSTVGYYDSYNYDVYTQSYRLFVLALAKSADLGAMNRLREYASLTTSAKWRLATAYSVAGQTAVAKKMITGLSYSVSPYTELSNTYGSDLRDEAMILESMVYLEKRTDAALLARKLSKSLNSDQWMSTQTTAYSLLAMSKFCGIAGTSKSMKFNYTIGNKTTDMNVTETIYNVKLNANKLPAKSALSFKNTGKHLL